MLQGGVLGLAWVGVALLCPHLPSVVEVLSAVVGHPMGAVVAPLGVGARGLLVAGAAAVAVDLVVDVDLVKHLPTFPNTLCIHQDTRQGGLYPDDVADCV